MIGLRPCLILAWAVSSYLEVGLLAVPQKRIGFSSTLFHFNRYMELVLLIKIMENLLNPQSNQNVIYEAKLHWIVYVIPIIMMLIGVSGAAFLLLSLISGYFGFTTLIAFFLSIPFFKGLSYFLRLRKTKIWLTPSQLSYETGDIGKKTVDIAVDKFKSLVLSQSFLGKQMNFGTLVIVAEESSNSLHIENPEKLRQEILKLSAETK